MRSRRLLLAGAFALVAASCSQPEPQVLSEAPRSTAATDVSSQNDDADPAARPGRFVARCATQADGGTPGATTFTDGSQGVTDHCLRRYYIGVQPSPGSVYVPDDEAGTYAPSRATGGVGNGEWTPAQPRTDAGPQQRRIDDQDLPVRIEDGESTTRNESTAPGNGTGNGDGTMPTAPVTSPGETSPTVVVTPTVPDGTVPGVPTTPTSPPAEPTNPPVSSGGSESIGSEIPSTTVPTITEVPGAQPTAIETSVTSTAASEPTGIGGLQSPSGAQQGTSGTR